MLNESLNNILSNFLNNYSADKNLCSSKITLSLLKGGESHAILYRFDINESHFVLRIPPAHANQLTRAFSTASWRNRDWIKSTLCRPSI